METAEIIESLKFYFTKVKNPILTFINYESDDVEIMVKGTQEEWEKFLNNNKE